MTEQEPLQSTLRWILQRVRLLAEQVRTTAKRVQRETEESRRLAMTAREHLEKSRELSRSGRQEADRVKGSIERSLDTGRDRTRAAAKSKRLEI